MAQDVSDFCPQRNFHSNEAGVSGLEVLAEVSLAAEKLPNRPNSVFDCMKTKFNAPQVEDNIYDKEDLSRSTNNNKNNTWKNENSDNSRRNSIISFLSSSDDDSPSFNYLHKLFDRRKARTNVIISSDQQNLNQNDYQQTRDSQTLLQEELHSCIDCGKKYSTSSNLARHRQIHRPPNDKEARRCPQCGKIYVSMPAYSMHVRTHNQKCACDLCGKIFSRPWLLQGHRRTHTGEKPFKCSNCGKAFADKSNLRAHVQTHSNLKPWTCDRCSKRFALRSYLSKHEESSCMRNYLKNEKGKGRLQTLKNKLLVRKRQNNDNKTQPKIETPNNLKITLTDSVKSKIREVLQENLRKSLQNKKIPEVNNKISVIRPTSDLQLWSNPIKLSFSV